MSLLRKSAIVGAALAAAPALAQDVTISVWMHEHPPRLPIDEQIVAEFEAAHPDIAVDLTIIPNSQFDERLQIAFAGGSGPDVFNNASFVLGQYANSGILAPVDVDAVGVDIASTFGSGIEGARIGDTLYGLPTEVSNYACVANVGLWNAAGLDPATDAPGTWSEMIDVAESLTTRDGSGNPQQRGFDFNWTDPIFMWLTFNPMVQQLGGEMIDEVALTADMDTAEVRQVMDYWSAWVNEHRLGGPQYTGSRDAFLAGELATECTFGSWGRGQFEDAGIDYAFFPVPRAEDGAVDTGFNAYAYYMMVNAQTDDDVQEAGWKFASFYAQQGDLLFEEVGLFTTVPSVQELDSYTSDPSNQIFVTELESALFSPRIPAFSEVGAEIARARDRIITGGEDRDEVLADLQSRVSQVLDRVRER